jgi:hypothetical protein
MPTDWSVGGGRLQVVRNCPRMLTALCLSADARTATLHTQRATDPDRVPTTAARLRGRTLFVDSNFDEPVASRFSEVVIDPIAP